MYNKWVLSSDLTGLKIPTYCFDVTGLKIPTYCFDVREALTGCVWSTYCSSANDTFTGGVWLVPPIFPVPSVPLQ